MKSLVIVSSTEDVASINIAEILKEKFDFKKGDEKFDGSSVFVRDNLRLIGIKRDLIFADNLGFSTDAYIFVSRHKSESEFPCLTAHFTGNFSNDNSFGGKPRELAFTCPSLFKEYIRQLWLLRELAPEYQIVIETTHHGPTSLTRPLMFVEIGSTEKEWRDTRAGEIVAKALMNAMKVMPIYDKVGIGFGGTHYSEKFTRFLVESEIALGAVAPKHALQFIDEHILSLMAEKSSQKVEYAVLDWKGLSKEKARIVEYVERANLEIVKI